MNRSAVGYRDWATGTAADFVDQVVPKLRHRTLFRTAYEGTTVHGNFGPKQPAVGRI